jgi:hypothetical protein
MKDFIDELKEDLSKYIVELTIGEQRYLYTTKEEYIGVTLTKSQVYNYYTKQVELVDFNEVTSYGFDGDENSNKDLALKRLQEINEDLSNCSYKFETENNIKRFYFNEFVDRNEFLLCKFFDFSIDLVHLAEDKIPNDRKEYVFGVFKKHIDENIKSSLEELEEFKNEVEEDDIEDIDSIVEIFKNTSDEVTFDGIETFTDLFNYWPPLLLPAPNLIYDNMSNISTFKKFVDSSLYEMGQNNCKDSPGKNVKTIDVIKNVNGNDTYHIIEAIEDYQSKNKNFISVNKLKEILKKNNL